jgi:hypothetical protein
MGLLKKKFFTANSGEIADPHFFPRSRREVSTILKISNPYRQN